MPLVNHQSPCDCVRIHPTPAVWRCVEHARHYLMCRLVPFNYFGATQYWCNSILFISLSLSVFSLSLFCSFHLVCSMLSIGLLLAAYDSNLTVTQTEVRTDSMSEVCVRTGCKYVCIYSDYCQNGTCCVSCMHMYEQS